MELTPPRHWDNLSKTSRQHGTESWRISLIGMKCCLKRSVFLVPAQIRQKSIVFLFCISLYFNLLLIGYLFVTPPRNRLLHLHEIVEGLYFHCNLSVCVSLCVSVCVSVCQLTKFQQPIEIGVHMYLFRKKEDTLITSFRKRNRFLFAYPTLSKITFKPNKFRPFSTWNCTISASGTELFSMVLTTWLAIVWKIKGKGTWSVDNGFTLCDWVCII